MAFTCSNGQEPHNVANIVYDYSSFLKLIGVDSFPVVGPLTPPLLVMSPLGFREPLLFP